MNQKVCKNLLFLLLTTIMTLGLIPAMASAAIGITPSPPVFTSYPDRALTYNTCYTWQDEVTAIDYEGGPPATNIIITKIYDNIAEGTLATNSVLDTSTVGSYTITYSVTNGMGLTATVTRNIQVGNPAHGGGFYPEINTIDVYLSLNESYTWMADVEAVDIDDVPCCITDNVLVSNITDIYGNTLTGSTLSTVIPNKYLVEYTVTDSDGNVMVTTRYITVGKKDGNKDPSGNDTYFPWIVAPNANLSLNDSYTLMDEIESWDHEDGTITNNGTLAITEVKNIKGEVVEASAFTTAEINLWTVSYEVIDSDGNHAYATRTIAVGAPTFTLNVEDITFAAITEGDSQPAAKAITIANSGNSVATITGVTVSGEAFEIDDTNANYTVTSGGENTTYTIRPDASLTTETYSETITVTYNGGVEATATVSIIVNALEDTETPSTASLEEMIKEAEALIGKLSSGDIGNGNGQYPQAAVEEFKNAIDNAKDVVKDSRATQEDIDYTKKDLLNAIENFQNNLIQVDFSQLDNAIIQAETLNESAYTAETWRVLENALSAGKTVRKTAGIIQAEVDTAAETVFAAIKTLESTYQFTTAFGTFTGSGSVTATVNAPYDKFVSLAVGGVQLDKSRYTVTEGSTVITLKEDYLKTLSNGTYAVSAEFTDGSTATTLTVNVSGTKSAICATLDKSIAFITVGNTLKLTATVSPTDATNKYVTWKSSDTSIAAVDAEGKVTGVKAGTATITVTTEDGGHTATCKVTVTAANSGSTTTSANSSSANTGDSVHFLIWVVIGAPMMGILGIALWRKWKVFG